MTPGEEIKNDLLFREYSRYVCTQRKKALEARLREEFINSRDMGQRPKYKLNRSVSKNPDFIRLLEQECESDPVLSRYNTGTLCEDEEFVEKYLEYEDVLERSMNPPFNNSKRLIGSYPAMERELLGNVRAAYLKSRAQEYADSLDLRSHVRGLVFGGFLSNFEKTERHIRNKNDFIRVLGLDRAIKDLDQDYGVLDADTLPDFLRATVGDEIIGLGYITKRVLKYSTVRGYLIDSVVKHDRQDSYYFPYIRERYVEILDELRVELSAEVNAHFTPERCAGLFLENESFAAILEEVNKKQRARELLKTEILETIPEYLPDLFPKARMEKRKFVIHAGPTNSGKTYEAIADLMKAESGAYLAPLRLLAYEQYENMNNHGVPCSLLTGEEKIIFEDAAHYSSTIEKADFSKKYDCVVIDEAQMMADRDRGGAWTFAVLGIASDRVHLCMSEDAVDLAIRVIESCGDDYEVVYHHRKTPLSFEDSRVRFPDGITKGDALIVFTRRDVHRVAAELQSFKVSCSIIYGALPYETRHREAERFARGETDVVVATDAIGMGMNLPIRRIIFLDTAKFDGHDRRLLSVSEIKQIAGRAGRFGIYDRGYVNAIYDRDLVETSLKESTEPLTEAVIGFPELLLKLNMPLSVIMEHWISLPCPDGYVRYDLANEIMLARVLEEYSDDKELIYRLVTIPFSESSDVLMSIWKELSLQVLSGKSCELRPLIPPIDNPDWMSVNERLGVFEEDYHICDLLFNFSEKFELGIFSGEIMERRREISDNITKLLVEQDLRPRKCRRCGKSIPWNFRYGVCEECFERTKSERTKRDTGRSHNRKGGRKKINYSGRNKNG